MWAFIMFANAHVHANTHVLKHMSSHAHECNYMHVCITPKPPIPLHTHTYTHTARTLTHMHSYTRTSTCTIQMCALHAWVGGKGKKQQIFMQKGEVGFKFWHKRTEWRGMPDSERKRVDKWHDHLITSVAVQDSHACCVCILLRLYWLL